jgi:hypothetical protein
MADGQLHSTAKSRAGAPLQHSHRGDKDESTMAPSTLDLFVLTFNCAKNLINVPVFSSHLQAAFSGSGGGLPEVVVL